MLTHSVIMSYSQERPQSPKKADVIRVSPEKYLDFMSAAALYVLYNMMSFLAVSSQYFTSTIRPVDAALSDTALWNKMNLPKQARPDFCFDDCEDRISCVVVLANEVSIEIRSDDAPFESQ